MQFMLTVHGSLQEGDEFLAVARGVIIMTLMAPRAVDRTDVEDRLLEITGDPFDDAWWDAAIPLHRQVSAEDRDISQAQQESVAGFRRPPVFGALEQRVAWFHEAYERAIGASARQRISS